MSDAERPPLAGFPLCRLWQREGMNGKPFYSGRLGAARVLVLPNKHRSDDQDATHILLIAEAPENRKPRKDRT